MKQTLFFVIMMLGSINLFSQTTFVPPRFNKTAIRNSGCFAYLPKGITETKFDLTYSPDSSVVYSAEIESGGFKYGVILVKLNSTSESSSKEEKEHLLISYLDFLKVNFEVQKSAGYGKGHTLSSEPEALGVIDYWEDKDGFKWAVKGWASNDKIAVMLVSGKQDYPDVNVLNLFLDGIRFK